MSDEPIKPTPPAPTTPTIEESPRELMYGFAIDRIYSLEARARIDGVKMLEGWKRELKVMRSLKALVEWLEAEELSKRAAEDKRGRR